MVTKHAHSRKLDERELSAIVTLLSSLIAGHENTLMAYRAAGGGWTTPELAGQITYSHNAISAYRHAIAIAKQRAGKQTNE